MSSAAAAEAAPAAVADLPEAQRPPSSTDDGARGRYPGAQSFTESADDRARFFGRVQEAEDLYLRVLSVPLMVHFGRSGLGKTSLLQAGLFPLLRRKPLLPVMVRLQDSGQTLVAAVAAGLREACAREGLACAPDAQAAGLWELLLATPVLRDEQALTPVLVFDQFEEVFTLRDEAFRQQLGAELGSLVDGTPPARLPTHAKGSRPPRPPVKVVISLREDYLGSLQAFSDALPALFHERLRLEPLSVDAAREAITGPAALRADTHGQPFDVAPFSYGDDALKAMVGYLQGRSGVIEPFQLQLLCRHAEQLARARQGRGAGLVTLTLADFGGGADFDTLLKTFYTRCINALPRDQRGRTRRLCEEGLLDADGHRLMLDTGQIARDFRVSEATLRQLDRDRVLRREPRLESVFYEISHDRLAGSILAARRFRLPRNWRYVLYGTLVVVPVVVAGLLSWGWSVDRERARAESLVGFLLGEDFLGQVRDAGLSEQLKRVGEQTRRTLEGEAPGLNRGLALRNAGDIDRLQGRSMDAVYRFAQAVSSFVPDEAATTPAAAGSAAEPLPLTVAAQREAARAHSRLGEVLAEQGAMGGALDHHRLAMRQWAAVDASGQAQPADCIAWGGSQLEAADLQHRQGDTAAAVQAVQAVVAKALAVLLGPSASEPACTLAAPLPQLRPQPDAAALALLGQAALLQGVLQGQPEAFDGAVLLGREAHRLRPLSTAVRTDALAALVGRAGQRAAKDPQATASAYREGLAEVDELLRLDPGNRPRQRERAALQLLLASLRPTCVDGLATACPPLVGSQAAGTLALDALVTLQTLTRLDPANQAWQGDLAWAHQVLADTMEGRSDERLRAYDRARAVQAPLAAGGNYEAQRQLARLLQQRAAAIWQMDNQRRSLDGQREAVALLQSMRQQWPDSVSLQTELQAAQALLSARARAVGELAEADSVGAAAAQGAQALQALRERTQAPDDVMTVRDGEALRARLLAQLDTTDMRQAASVVPEVSDALARWRRYVGRRPADPRGYLWLASCYQLLDQAQGKSGATTSAPLPQRALRSTVAAAMQAADVARVLGAGAPESGHQRRAQDLLADARHRLATLLINDALDRLPTEPAQADAQLDDGLRVLEAMVADADAALSTSALQPGGNAARRHERLLEAQYVLGLVRNLAHRIGWEEAWRSGVLQSQRALALHPRNMALWLQRGQLLLELGEKMREQNNGPQARDDLTEAQAAFRVARQVASEPLAAGALPPTVPQRDQTDSGLSRAEALLAKLARS
jgi:hypothetical protein